MRSYVASAFSTWSVAPGLLLYRLCNGTMSLAIDQKAARAANLVLEQHGLRGVSKGNGIHVSSSSAGSGEGIGIGGNVFNSGAPLKTHMQKLATVSPRCVEGMSDLRLMCEKSPSKHSPTAGLLWV